jgi:hypothetical protein
LVATIASPDTVEFSHLLSARSGFICSKGVINKTADSVKAEKSQLSAAEELKDGSFIIEAMSI